MFVMKILVIVLCGGKNTRMRAAKPKFLLEVAGVPILHHILCTIQEVQRRLVSHGVCMQNVSLVLNEKNFDNPEIDTVLLDFPELQICKITQQVTGTGGAVLSVLYEVEGYDGVLMLYGDMPLIKEDTLYEFVQNYRKRLALKRNFISLHLAFIANDSRGYGIIKTDIKEKLRVIRIVESAYEKEKYLSKNPGKIMCNAGAMITQFHMLKDALLNVYKVCRIEDEFPLTEVVSFFFGLNMVSEYRICERSECINTNNLSDLSRAEEEMQNRIRLTLMNGGVHLIAPHTNFFHYYSSISVGVVIHPYSIIGKNVMIYPNAVILPYCYIEGAIIEPQVTIGPFCRIRGDTLLKSGAKVGNFLEVKNSIIGENTKIGHFGYVGDATIGDRCNIGAGTVFCNYDGYEKHRTVVKSKAFIGANVSLVAPVSVGDTSMIGAGSTITQDVPNYELAIERNVQRNIKRKRFTRQR
ncbi:NTP transferase domain-containing protein [Candidatus Fokinia crypta]|uniref:Bifunctional protein GlmU n=1 Tax=Candidatus Fokinia crypta TaxID=1920990 RepID=A0ABZ0UNZ2_9RICK|nr:NTP transferase domain-containing protein [Candidatus Fokinia cryptica]WPX97836.1 Bifunctional protein GlmU [Candidatus Fokinia cryptica]